MTATLFAVGASYLMTAVGLTGVRLPARILLAIAGICSAGIASSPVLPDGPTALHLTWATLGAVTTALWPAVAGWRVPPRPKIVSGRRSAMVTMLFVALLVWLALEAFRGSDVGLAERLVSSTQTAWPFVVALLLRRAGATPASSASTKSLLGQLGDGPQIPAAGEARAAWCQQDIALRSSNPPGPRLRNPRQH